MNTAEAIAYRIRQLCKERGITPNGLSNLAAVPQSTIKSILNGESQNPGSVTIKMLCDAFAAARVARQKAITAYIALLAVNVKLHSNILHITTS